MHLSIWVDCWVDCRDSPVTMDDVAAPQALILSCGRMMYFGPREGLVAWFSGLGYEWSARHGNVADWAMDLVNVGFNKQGAGQVGASGVVVVGKGALLLQL